MDELERIAFSLRINLRVRITAVSALNPNDRELHRLRLKGERDFIWRYDNIESEIRCRFAETFIKKYLEGLDPHGLEGQSEQIRRVVLELQQDLRLPVSSDDELQSTSLEDLLTLMADLKAEFAWKRRQSVGC